jgi:hypothetical protein
VEHVSTLADIAPANPRAIHGIIPLQTRAARGNLPRMQNYGVSPFLFICLLCSTLAQAAATKPHMVTFGSVRRVPYLAPDQPTPGAAEDATTLKVRPLLVDGRQKEWTTGDAHDVTDRSFTIRRA